MIKASTSYLFSVGLPIACMLGLFLLNPFNLGYFFALLVFPMLLVKKQFISRSIDKNILFLAMFSIIFALFYALDADASRGQFYIAFYSILPVTFYLLGKYLVKATKSRDHIFYVFFAIFSLYSFSAVVSVMISFLEGGFSEFNRSIPMFWTGEPMSATIMGSYLTFNMVIPAILIASLGRRKLQFQILAMAVFGISLICAIRLGSRTQLAIFLITSFLSLIYVVPRQPAKKNVVLFFLMGLAIYLVSTKVSFDLNEDWLTNFADRMGKPGSDIASGGGRTERWVKSIENLYKKPLGWSVDEFGFAHNMWLDVLRAGSIISFLLLIVISVRSFFTVRKSVSISGNNIPVKMMFIVYSLAFFLIFMVEPIFDGIFSLFMLFCLFLGAADRYTDESQNNIMVQEDIL